MMVPNTDLLRAMSSHEASGRPRPGHHPTAERGGFPVFAIWRNALRAVVRKHFVPEAGAHGSCPVQRAGIAGQESV